MKNWYVTREGGSLTHRGQAIPEGKKILLSKAQAKLHNQKGEKVAKCDAPVEPVEAGVLAEYSEWSKANKSSAVTTSEPTEKTK